MKAKHLIMLHATVHNEGLTVMDINVPKHTVIFIRQKL